jgi:pimeloyl-ACP methyl ester carboxylesterase
VARVVCVHGVGQQRKGPEVLRREWAPALRDGVKLSGETRLVLADADVECAFYGDVFRPAGRMLDPGDPWLTAADADGFESGLLAAWWEAAAASDPGVIDPGARSLAVVPGGVQAALRALSGSAFFAGVADRALLWDLRQVRLYMTDPGIRAEVQRRVASAVGADTRVVVGHSLGSVVAYEALCAHPEWPVAALVTLGSPLGIRNLIFDRLCPPPTAGPRGAWPGSARTWANVADRGDAVALVKDLRPLFGDRVACWLVSNGATVHAVQPYLTAPETGAAIEAGLRDAGRPR